MTDAQLSVLLYQYAERLSALIDAVHDALPDEAKPTFTRKANAFDTASALMNMRQPQDEIAWTECPILADLRSFVQELKQDSEILELAARNHHRESDRKGTTS